MQASMHPASQHQPAARWIILALSALTAAFTVAAPSMSLSVLFKEISTDLHLDLVQVGMVWSIGSLPAILTALLSGTFIDRFGPRRIIITGVLAVGIAGSLRGLAVNFTTLLLAIMLLGALSPLITMASYKVNGMWFPANQLGLANGVFSMGMALGFMLGSFFSATLLSPWLGGWRGVMFFFGGLAWLFCIPWIFAPEAPRSSLPAAAQDASLSMRGAFSQVVRFKDLWLVGVAMLGYSGSIQGMLGYLPLHLRDIGWSAVSADSAQTLFHAMSMIFVVPIAFFSDRFRQRRGLMLVILAVTLAAMSMLIFSGGWPVWAAVVLIGIGRDASMALLFTMGIQTRGVGIHLAGTATGIVSFFSFIGSLLSSPIGNSLAQYNSGAPFAFWAGMVALAIACLLMLSPHSTRQVEE